MATPTCQAGPGHNDIQRRVVQVRLSLDSHFCLRYANALVKIQMQINSLDELRQHCSKPARPLPKPCANCKKNQRLPCAQLNSLCCMKGRRCRLLCRPLVAVVPPACTFKDPNRRSLPRWTS